MRHDVHFNGFPMFHYATILDISDISKSAVNNSQISKEPLKVHATNILLFISEDRMFPQSVCLPMT